VVGILVLDRLMEFCKQDRLLCNGHRVLSPWYSGRGEKLSSQLRLRPKLRTGGHIPLIPLCAFIMWTETTLHLKA
jgi:hypothetical protein